MSFTTRLGLVAVLLVPALPTARALAGDAPVARTKNGEAAVAAFGRWQDLEKAAQEAQSAASAKTSAAKTDDEKKAARDEFMKVLREHGKKAEAAKNEFRAAFMKTNAEGWDPKTDADLVEKGLMEWGEYEIERDPVIAAACYEAVLKQFPASGSAMQARTTWLPIALPAAASVDGTFDAAVARLTALAADAPEPQRPGMAMQIADVFALEGRYDEAQRRYAEALASIPNELKEAYDARKYVKAELEARIATIGKPAPGVDSKVWVGGEAHPLSALRGHVVVLDFWATWCGPCCHGIPGMIALHQARAKDGLVVLGVTTNYRNGFLPSGPDQLRLNFKDGEAVLPVGADGKPDPAANLALVTKFRDRMGVPYPFVIAAKPDFEAYRIGGIPTVYVIGKDGRIGYVAIGSCRDVLIRAAAERLLREDDQAPASDAPPAPPSDPTHPPGK